MLMSSSPAEGQELLLIVRSELQKKKRKLAIYMCVYVYIYTYISLTFNYVSAIRFVVFFFVIDPSLSVFSIERTG